MDRAGRWVPLALAAVTWATAARADRPWFRSRDALLRPKPPGTRLHLLTFMGPGVRANLEHRQALEKDMSELEARAQGDMNLGFSDASGHLQLRLASLFVGGSVGYRYVWRSLRFTPDENGLDHGGTRLTRGVRIRKDDDGDFQADAWPWYEARTRFALPFDRFVVVGELAGRWEGRADRSFSWEYATVVNQGWHLRSEALLFYRNPRFGFIGPIFRLFHVPRTRADGRETYGTEFQYGLFVGTSPGWSTTDHVLLARIYTTAGLPNRLMGIHPYRAPIQVVLGYQVELDFKEEGR